MQPDDYIQLIKDASDLSELKLSVPGDWAQGRTVFGGLSAGILYQVLKCLVPAERVLRSITFNFVGPLNTDEDFGFSWQLLREGKNATQITANIVQNDQICLTALACFAQDRSSKVQVDAHSKELPEPPKKAKYIPQIPRITPKFLRHIDLSISEGKTPFTGSKSSSYKGWMRLKKAPKVFTDAHILTLIDAWPPTILQMPLGPAPASTMSWNVEFVHPHKPLAAEDWLAYEAHTVQAYGGYAHAEAKIYDKEGELVAISRQLIAIFDQK